jgi:hypothetical protein
VKDDKKKPPKKKRKKKKKERRGRPPVSLSLSLFLFFLLTSKMFATKLEGLFSNLDKQSMIRWLINHNLGF